MKTHQYHLHFLRVSGGVALLVILSLARLTAQGVTKPNEPGPFPGMFVNTHTGNLVFQQTALLLPGPGISLNATFTYNSGRSARDRGFGHGWSFTGSMGYIRSGDTVFIDRADGRRDAFPFSGTEYISPRGVYDKLTEYQPGRLLLASRHGLRYYFDDPVYRQLTAIEDRNGNRITLIREDGRITTATDGSGRVWHFTWTGDHLAEIRDPNAVEERVVTFAYDTENNLTELTDPAGNSIRFSYSPEHKMLSSTNRLGTQVNIYYNNNHAVTGILCGTPTYKKTFDYDDRTLTTTVYEYVLESIRLTRYTFDEKGRIIRMVYPDNASVEYTWEEADNIIAREDELGHVTQYDWDSRGNLLMETNPLGHIKAWTYSPDYNLVMTSTDPLGHHWLQEYDGNGNLITQTDPAGNSERYTWDSQGNLLTRETRLDSVYQYSYDPNGYVTSCTDPSGNTESWSYDAAGNRTGAINRYGYASSVEYDRMNRPVRRINELGFEQRMEYDPAGNLTRFTDYGGAITRFEYDGFSRLVSRVDPLGNPTLFAYDEAGNRMQVTDALGGIWRNSYDDRNRLVEQTDALGYPTVYQYDLAGRCIRETDKRMNSTTYTWDAPGRLTAVSDPSGMAETYVWDACGNLVRFTNRLGHSFTRQYNLLNQLVGITGPSGEQTTFIRDAEGNLTGDEEENEAPVARVLDPVGRVIRTERSDGLSFNYSYDSQGNRISETNSAGATVNYAYDLMNRLVGVTSPMGHQLRYTYDAVGNVATRTDPEGRLTRYTYDPVGRMTETLYPVGGAYRSYDPEGNVVLVRHTGLGLGETTTRTWDPMNRMVSESIDYGAFARTVGYEWDAVGNLTRVTDPEGLSIRYRYNPMNRVTMVVDPDSDTTRFAYLTGGAYDRISYPTGEWNRSLYNGENRLVTLETRDSNNHVIFRHDYQYDTTGQLSESWLNGIIEARYHHTPVQRLLDAEYPFHGKNVLYGYDAAGNRITESGPGGTVSCWYNPENRITSRVMPDLSAIQYHYDRNGNVVQTVSNWGTVTYGYDYENRLVSVLYPPPHAPVHTFYSVEGRQLARFTREGQRYYLPSLAGVLAEMDSTGAILTRMNPGISFTDETGVEADKIFQHWDGRLSTRFFTGHSIVASLTFDYYGLILGSAGVMEEVDAGLTFAGNPIDWDSGFGAELMGVGYAPDIASYFGNGAFTAWKDPEARQIWLEEGIGTLAGQLNLPGSAGLTGPLEPVDTNPLNGGGPVTPGAQVREPAGLCGYTENVWETIGTEWVYVGCYVDKNYLPQKRLIFKYEKKQRQKEVTVTCWLEKGHPGHHRDSERVDAGRTRLESYKPPFYKYQKSGQLQEWPDPATRDAEGRKRLEELKKNN